MRFVYDLDKNTNTGQGNDDILPYWQRYCNYKPCNVVLNMAESRMEDDTFRKVGIGLWILMRYQRTYWLGLHKLDLRNDSKGLFAIY